MHPGRPRTITTEPRFPRSDDISQKASDRGKPTARTISRVEGTGGVRKHGLEPLEALLVLTKGKMGCNLCLRSLFDKSLSSYRVSIPRRYLVPLWLSALPSCLHA